MIIVTGNIVVKPECLDQALVLSHRHVAHSRGEKGCLSHQVYADTNDPCCLFFFEEWDNDESLSAHFALPTSQQFVRALAPLCSEAPNLNMYQAKPITR